MSDHTTARREYVLHQRRQSATTPQRCISGRVRYADRVAALVALATILRQDKTDRVRTESSSYQCHRCSGWHLAASVQH